MPTFSMVSGLRATVVVRLTLGYTPLVTCTCLPLTISRWCSRFHIRYFCIAVTILVSNRTALIPKKQLLQPVLNCNSLLVANFLSVTLEKDTAKLNYFDHSRESYRLLPMFNLYLVYRLDENVVTLVVFYFDRTEKFQKKSAAMIPCKTRVYCNYNYRSKYATESCLSFLKFIITALLCGEITFNCHAVL